jgi:hypothetical protein
VSVLVAASTEALSQPSGPATLHWSHPADITSGASAVGSLTFKFQLAHSIPTQTKITFLLPYVYLSSVATCSFGAGSAAQGSCVLAHGDIIETALVCTTSVANISAGHVELVLQGGSFTAGALLRVICDDKL